MACLALFIVNPALCRVGVEPLSVFIHTSPLSPDLDFCRHCRQPGRGACYGRRRSRGGNLSLFFPLLPHPPRLALPRPAPPAGIAVNLAGGVWYGSLKFKPPPLKGGGGGGMEAKHPLGDDAEAGEGLLGGSSGGGGGAKGGQQPEAGGGTGAQYHLHEGHHRHPAGQ